MGPELVQKQSLKLKMAPAMYQSVRLLQFNRYELVEFMREQSLENPLLHIDESSGPVVSGSSGANGMKSSTEVIEQTLADTFDFRDVLRLDLHRLPLDDACTKIADRLIDLLDAHGYLKNWSEIRDAAPWSDADAARALTAVQSLDPAGIGARSLGECLLLQLRRKPKRNPVAERIVTEYIDCFLTQDWAGLAETLGCPEEKVAEAVALIRTLDPVPVQEGDEPAVPYVTPDLTVIKENGELTCQMEERDLPKLTIRTDDFERLMKKGDPEARQYLKQKREEAEWLISCLSRRRRTLVALAKIVIDRQRDFFLTGEKEALMPLSMQEAARRLDLHISTISRAVSGKYVQTAYGLYPMKTFFVRAVDRNEGGLTAFKIQALIRGWIEAEDKRRPLPDRQLAAMLEKEGYRCSRRAVAKYRKLCGIGSTVERRLRNKKQDAAPHAPHSFFR